MIFMIMLLPTSIKKGFCYYYWWTWFNNTMKLIQNMIFNLLLILSVYIESVTMSFSHNPATMVSLDLNFTDVLKQLNSISIV